MNNNSVVESVEEDQDDDGTNNLTEEQWREIEDRQDAAFGLYGEFESLRDDFVADADSI
jgi:hypothetical protein